MDELWTVVSELAVELHPLRLESLASNIERLRSPDDLLSAKAELSPNIDKRLVHRLLEAWESNSEITPISLATGIRCASATALRTRSDGSVELVWTGPDTGFVPIRHTSQVLCELIDSAQKRVFMVSFVAYEIPQIHDALRRAVGRAVKIDFLLEAHIEKGGGVTQDSAGLIAQTVPSANVYTWRRSGRESRGAVHAKCAVADEHTAFLTSANLTSAALEKNMELGVLVSGGSLPDNLGRHLNALITTGVIERV